MEDIGTFFSRPREARDREELQELGLLIPRQFSFNPSHQETTTVGFRPTDIYVNDFLSKYFTDSLLDSSALQYTTAYNYILSQEMESKNKWEIAKRYCSCLLGPRSGFHLERDL